MDEKKQNMKYDEERGAYVYHNPDKNETFLWDPSSETWVTADNQIKDTKKANANQDNNNGGHVDRNVEQLDFERLMAYERLQTAMIEEDDYQPGPDKRKRKKRPRTELSLYITGVSPEITEEEFLEAFRKAGVLRKDPETRKEDYQLFEDDQGKRTGEAYVTYFMEESVGIAFQILDGLPIKYGTPPIKLQLASEAEVEIVMPKKTRKKGVKLYDQATELEWEEKEQVHVVLKNMFDHQQIKHDMDFYKNLKEELQNECSNFGPVESVKVFERNPEGIVVIKFNHPIAATRCIEKMNGRYFDKRRLIAEHYDGFSNFFVPETEEDKRIREEAWAKWLEGRDQGGDDDETDSRSRSGSDDSDD